MPIRPKRPCSHPGCPELVTSGRCEAHMVKQTNQFANLRKSYDQQRGTAASRGYDARWTAYSKQYRIDYPLCVECLRNGILTSVEHGGHVDHIVAVRGKNDPLFWDPNNHQSLCHSCHSAKTAREDQGFGNKE